MDISTKTSKNSRHYGRNIKRVREILGIKQEDLADRLCMTQSNLSRIENTSEIAKEQLEKVAKALNVPVDSLSNFTEESTVNIFQNRITHSSLNAEYNNCTFNPIDKIVELYERVIQAEKEKNEVLMKMVGNNDIK